MVEISWYHANAERAEALVFGQCGRANTLENRKLLRRGS
jgi:hypothetical protein